MPLLTCHITQAYDELQRVVGCHFQPDKMRLMVTGCVRPANYADQGVSAFVLQRPEITGAWCAVEFPEKAAATACAAVL